MVFIKKSILCSHLSDYKRIMIIDGRSIANTLLAKLHREVEKLQRKPKLSVILIGTNPASLSYIKQKERSAIIAGIDFELRQLSVDISEADLIQHIYSLNKDSSVS